MASGYHVSTSVDSHPTVLVLYFCEIQNGRKLETSGGWGAGCFLALPASFPSWGRKPWGSHDHVLRMMMMMTTELLRCAEHFM